MLINSGFEKPIASQEGGMNRNEESPALVGDRYQSEEEAPFKNM
jgi:hypothetical protein